MIIRTSDRDIHVIAVYDDIMTENKRTFPALRFEFEAGVSTEEIQSLMSGSFEILNDLGEALGTHEGYNTLNKVSVTIAQVKTAEQERDEAEQQRDAAEQERDELQETLNILLGGEVE